MFASICVLCLCRKWTCGTGSAYNRACLLPGRGLGNSGCNSVWRAFSFFFLNNLSILHTAYTAKDASFCSLNSNFDDEYLFGMIQVNKKKRRAFTQSAHFNALGCECKVFCYVRRLWLSDRQCSYAYASVSCIVFVSDVFYIVSFWPITEPVVKTDINAPFGIDIIHTVYMYIMCTD